MILREAFDYPFSRIDPTGDHIDPPSVAIYDTLIAKAVDGTAQPMLADGWETSADGLEVTIRLRRGARFHSGEQCDARAVLAALDHLRFDTFPERQLWYWDPVDTVEAVDPETLVLRLLYPYARLPSLLWGTHTAVYDEARRAADPAGSGHEFANGTGPYRLVSWSPERVVAECVPGDDRATLDRIEWLSILDEGDRLAALESGAVHVLHGPPLGEVERLREEGRFVVHEQPQASNMYIALDWGRTDLGFDDLRVREAVSLAVNREALVREALSGHGTVAYGPVPPGDEHYDASVGEQGRHDPARARALLEEAGVQIRCDCVVQDDPVFRRVAALVREQLAEVGVQLELRFAAPFAPFYGAVAARPPASLSKWLWQDPIDALIGFTASSTRPFPNWQHASVPDLDEAYDRWLRATTSEELSDAASAVQRIFARELPYIPLLTPNDVWMWSPAVSGFEPSPAILYPFYAGVSVLGRVDHEARDNFS
jgi:peptide/nickel transport system substrate-binding protein